MYVRCCLVEIARKSVTESANVGRRLSGVGWSTILWRCQGGRISNYCSWLIPARQRRLDVHNLLQYMC